MGDPPAPRRRFSQLWNALLTRVKRDGLQSSARHYSGMTKLVAYQLFYDRRLDRLETRKSGQARVIDQEELVGPIPPPEDRLYRAFPRLPFRWSIEALQIDPAAYSFIDYGSGRGRIVLAAAQLPFRRVIGVESSRNLYLDAIANVADYPRERLKCDDIVLLNKNALEFELPPGNVVAFFYNPFTGDLLDQVARQIEESCRTSDRSVYIVFANSKRVPLFTRCGDLQPFRPSIGHWIRLAIMAPVPIEFYSVEQATKLKGPQCCYTEGRVSGPGPRL